MPPQPSLASESAPMPSQAAGFQDAPPKPSKTAPWQVYEPAPFQGAQGLAATQKGQANKKPRTEMEEVQIEEGPGVKSAPKEEDKEG